MGTPEPKTVVLMGLRVEVTGAGTCDDCGKPTYKIIDPEGQEDEIHQEDTDA